MIMELRREGWSFGAIAYEMNEREILNLKSKQGWSKGAVYRVVMNVEKRTPLPKQAMMFDEIEAPEISKKEL